MPSPARDAARPPVAELPEVGGVVSTVVQVGLENEGNGRVLRVAVVGDLDLVVETELVQEFQDAVRVHRPDRTVLDLTRVPFLDSSGLRGLLRCSRAAEDHGVLLRLAVLPGPVTMLLDTAGVRDWFTYE